LVESSIERKAVKLFAIDARLASHHKQVPFRQRWPYSPKPFRRRSSVAVPAELRAGAARRTGGAIGGSGAEYINHSCAPNLRAAVSRRRLYLLSLRPIEAGEELLIDYRISSERPRMPCCCGADSYRGYLNLVEQHCD